MRIEATRLDRRNGFHSTDTPSSASAGRFWASRCATARDRDRAPADRYLRDARPGGHDPGFGRPATPTVHDAGAGWNDAATISRHSVPSPQRRERVPRIAMGVDPECAAWPTNRTMLRSDRGSSDSGGPIHRLRAPALARYASRYFRVDAPAAVGRSASCREHHAVLTAPRPDAFGDTQLSYFVNVEPSRGRRR